MLDSLVPSLMPLPSPIPSAQPTPSPTAPLKDFPIQIDGAMTEIWNSTAPFSLDWGSHSSGPGYFIEIDIMPVSSSCKSEAPINIFSLRASDGSVYPSFEIHCRKATSAEPTAFPTVRPTAFPTVRPSARPTTNPTPLPTSAPTPMPTFKATPEPTFKADEPTPGLGQPSGQPTGQPSYQPSTHPTAINGSRPTSDPTQTYPSEPPYSIPETFTQNVTLVEVFFGAPGRTSGLRKFSPHSLVLPLGVSTTLRFDAIQSGEQQWTIIFSTFGGASSWTQKFANFPPITTNLVTRAHEADGYVVKNFRMDLLPVPGVFTIAGLAGTTRSRRSTSPEPTRLCLSSSSRRAFLYPRRPQNPPWRATPLPKPGAELPARLE